MSDKDRLRILQREDGAVFTWTKELAESRPDMRPGWQYKQDDGSFLIELDKVSSQTIRNQSISQREKALIEENARLAAALAKAEGMPVASEPAKTPVDPGEVPLPPPPPVEEIPVVGQDSAFKRVSPSVVSRWGSKRLVQEIAARGGNAEIEDPEDIPALRALFDRLQDAAEQG